MKLEAFATDNITGPLRPGTPPGPIAEARSSSPETGTA
jgi:hypothetical protein